MISNQKRKVFTLFDQILVFSMSNKAAINDVISRIKKQTFESEI